MITQIESSPKLKLCDMTETQERLGKIGRTMVYRLVNAGELQLVKIGTRSFITSESLDDYIGRLSQVS